MGSLMALKFRAELIEPAPRGGWYVSNGDQSVGPVALELLVRGVESGRVPVEAFVRHNLTILDGMLVVDSQNLAGDPYVGLALAARATSTLRLVGTPRRCPSGSTWCTSVWATTGTRRRGRRAIR